MGVGICYCLRGSGVAESRELSFKDLTTVDQSTYITSINSAE